MLVKSAENKYKLEKFAFTKNKTNQNLAQNRNKAE